MAECTLTEILDAREDRVRRREALQKETRCPVLSMTMNIPGAVKDSPLIRRTFGTWLSRIRTEFEAYSVAGPEVRLEKTGPEVLWVLRLPAQNLKKRCVLIEESDPAGRLLDLDVFDENGNALSRTELGFPERPCIVCGAAGRACAAGQRHPLEDVRHEAERRMQDYFQRRDPEAFAGLAEEALIKEVRVTPKPGLVDRRNNGSHKDMDLSLMEKSAKSLRPYFEACIRTGMNSASDTPEDTFLRLRKLGVEAENEMFSATGGVNTHKGAVYLFGILLGAFGRLWQADRLPSPEEMLREGGRIAARAVEEDLERIREKAASSKGLAGETIEKLTAGERIFLEYGLKGARGEAQEGFPTIRETALPYLNTAGMTEKKLSQLLLRIISLGKDTNLIARGGMDTASQAVSEIRKLLQEGEADARTIESLDDSFIRKNLSPGGSADLLAVSIFCKLVKTMT